MDYAEALEVFFQPRDAAAPEPGSTAWESPARRLRDAAEPIAALSFWSKPHSDAFAELGLDFLLGYAWARGCVLGEPDGAVVAAAFGVFEPGLIAQLWDGARAQCSLAQIRAARERASAEAMHAVLGEPEQAAHVTAVLRRGLAAADTAARPLFAGMAAMPWPEDELAQLWHACTLLRELRGDAHLAACAAAGLTGLEANIVTELAVGWAVFAYTGTRGWSPEAMDAALAGLRERGLASGDTLTGAGRALRASIEAATDLQMSPVLAAIGDDLAGILPLLDGWSQAITDYGWFPPDPYKAASG